MRRASAHPDGIPPVVYGNPRRPELSLEVLALSELRRKAPSGYLARPQRPTFHALLAPTRGRCVHEIDFERVRASPGQVFWVRPGQVQRFHVEKGVEGWLVLFTADVLAPGFEEPLGPRFDLGSAANDAAWLIERLRRFSDDLTIDLGTTRAMLHHLLHALLVLLRHSARERGGQASHASGSVFALFRAEVERRFARTREVQEYARLIGYSEKTLTRATQAAVGTSAKVYVDRRVLLESQRLLAHTDLGTSEIASRLGFSEATNFIKFFQRAAKESPTAFRARARA